MSLSVTERQITETWYELGGDLEARELFPNLLPNSESVKEVEENISTEHEEGEGKYDGFPSELDEMPDEIEEFTESAIAEFHDEVMTAAKARLTALQSGQTLLRGDFEDAEEAILNEAAKELGIPDPWDPVETAQIAAYEAAEEARQKQMREEEEQRKKEAAEVLEKARTLFQAGTSHATVRGMFPTHEGRIGQLVGDLRRQGVHVPR